MIHPYIEIVHRTNRALLIKFEKGDCWVPKAMIEELDESKVEIYDNFRFKYLPKEDKVEDLFDEIEPVVKKIEKIKQKFDKGEHKIINPDNLDLEIYYTDGTRRDEMPF